MKPFRVNVLQIGRQFRVEPPVAVFPSLYVHGSLIFAFCRPEDCSTGGPVHVFLSYGHDEFAALARTNPGQSSRASPGLV